MHYLSLTFTDPTVSIKEYIFTYFTQSDPVDSKYICFTIKWKKNYV